jgi:predicted amidohydrolase
MDFRVESLSIEVDEQNYKKNLESLLDLIQESNSDFILAPELCLSGYSYDSLQDAAKFSFDAVKKIQPILKNKTLILTIIREDSNKFYNTLTVVKKDSIEYYQDKSKLFTLNDEDKYFSSGDEEKIKIYEIDGLKIAFLICFELRFIDLWREIQGAYAIFIPAMWGKKRKEHFLALSRGLAIANQCYVITSNTKNEDNGSSIISPFGEVIQNDSSSSISLNATIKEIKTMRRYMNTGISL